MKIPIALLSLLCFVHAVCAAETPAPSANPVRTVRLLTVGNSFSANATKYLAELAQAGGHELVHRPIVVGGASLELHATKAQAHERDPADKGGRYSDGSSLKQILGSDRWDYVTIQQASIKSHELATYQPFARQLADLIRRHAPQATLLVHQTWAYRCDDPRFVKPSGKPGEPATQEAMYRGLSAAYRTVAEELGARIIPVGGAFFFADTDPQWGYRAGPVFQADRPPILRVQAHSLHVGWLWRKQPDDTIKLAMDGHHANLAGCYLGGCVWYEVLFGVSPVGNAFIPPTLDPAFARHLQEVAHRAVAEATRPR